MRIFKLRQKKSKEYTCPKCLKPFKKFEVYKRHYLKKHHNIDDIIRGEV